jgi:hypothetical protein
MPPGKVPREHGTFRAQPGTFRHQPGTFPGHSGRFRARHGRFPDPTVLARSEERPIEHGDVLLGLMTEYRKLGKQIPLELKRALPG